MSNDDNENKVVPFPSHKVRKTPSQVAETLGRSDAANGISTVFPKNRITIALSLLSTVVVATLIASRVNNNRDVVMTDFATRNPAQSADSSRRDLQEDLVLSKTRRRFSS